MKAAAPHRLTDFESGEDVNSHPKVIDVNNVINVNNVKNVKNVNNDNNVQTEEEKSFTDMSYKSKLVAVFTLMFCIFSVCFCLFAFVLRKGENLLIPIALMFQAWAYLITTLLMMYQNEKLRDFALKQIFYFYGEMLCCNSKIKISTK